MKSKIFFTALLALIFSGFVHAGKAKYSQVIREFYTAIDAGDFEKAASFLSPEVKATLPMSPQPLDLEGYRQLGMSFRAGFPDMQHKVLEVTEGKNSAAIKGWFSGTNTAALQGNPPTGNRVEFPFLGYYKFDKAGKITEVNISFDQAAFMAQLTKGLPPMPSPHAAVVQQIYADFGKGNIQGVLENLSDDIVWTDPGASVGDLYAGARNGKEEVLDFFGDLKEHLDITMFEPREFLSEGKKVTATGYVAGTARATGLPFATDWAMTWEFNEAGKVNRHHLFLDTDNIAKALAKPGSKACYEFLAAMDAGDLAGLKAAVAPGFMIYHPNFPTPLSIEEHFEQQVKPFNSAFSNFRHKAVDVCADGNKITLRGVVTGKHVGELMGIPATGNEVNVPWLAFFTLDGQGKIKEMHVQFNQLLFLSQLGVNPMTNK